MDSLAYAWAISDHDPVVEFVWDIRRTLQLLGGEENAAMLYFPFDRGQGATASCGDVPACA